MTCFGQLNNSLINDMSPYMICPCSDSAEEGELGSGLLCSKCLSAVAGTTCMQYIYRHINHKTDSSVLQGMQRELGYTLHSVCVGLWQTDVLILGH